MNAKQIAGLALIVFPLFVIAVLFEGIKFAIVVFILTIVVLAWMMLAVWFLFSGE